MRDINTNQFVIMGMRALAAASSPSRSINGSVLVSMNGVGGFKAGNANQYRNLYSFRSE